MLFSPPLAAPYRPLYTDQEWPPALARYELALKARERESDIAFRITVLEAVCWFAAIVVASACLLRAV